MRRRPFLILLAASIGVPGRLRAQQASRPRLGWLTNSVVHTENVEAFRQGMEALGYRDFDLEVRAAGGQLDRLPALAAELVALDVQVIITDGGPAAPAARQATTTIPIVIGATAADLVQQGLVASLARPGGNVTGFTISTGAELDGKRLELLRETVPALARVAVVWNSRNEVARSKLPAVEVAARRLGLQLEAIGARDVPELEGAFDRAARSRASAVLTMADAFFWSERARIVALANRRRFPAIFPEAEYAEAGGLMAYGPNVRENFRRAADYVDRILRGTRPGDLPVEQPAKFDLLINMRTARAIGLAIPSSLRLRADRLIE